MKKLIVSFAIATVLLLVFAGAAFADIYSFDESSVAPITADKPSVSVDGVLMISLDFYIPDEALAYLEKNAEDLSVYAVVSYRDPDPASALLPTEGVLNVLEKTGETNIGEKKHRIYTLDLGVTLPEDYDKPFAVRGFVSYTLAGAGHTVGSDFGSKNIISPRDRVFDAYCDRSDVQSAEYPYLAPDGSYTYVEDLTSLKRIIASSLNVKIENDMAVDMMENEVYTSIYELDYFDGVLTVSLPGGDVTDWLTSKLTVNGEERYFEIYDGRIRLIV